MIRPAERVRPHPLLAAFPRLAPMEAARAARTPRRPPMRQAPGVANAVVVRPCEVGRPRITHMAGSMQAVSRPDKHPYEFHHGVTCIMVWGVRLGSVAAGFVPSVQHLQSPPLGTEVHGLQMASR